MKRRSLLQGLALLIPGVAVAPAVAKTIVEPKIYRKPLPPVAPVEGDLWIDTTEYMEIMFSDLQDEAYEHPDFGKFDSDGRPTLFIGNIFNTLMRDKQKAARYEGKLLRLVYHPNHICERVAPPSPDDRYYLPGGFGIRYLAAEVVIRNTDGTEAVIKSKDRPITKVAGLGSA